MQNVDFQSISDIYLRRKRKDLKLKEIRMHTEMETMFKYPVLCEKRTNEAYFTVDTLDEDKLGILVTVVVFSSSISQPRFICAVCTSFFSELFTCVCTPARFTGSTL